MTPLLGPGATRHPARSTRYSVVVVGARCAGAATALLLARAGHDVLLVDRATLPSDTNSTHGLVRGGVVQLARWGLLEEVLASGAPAVRSVTFQRYDDGSAPLRLPIADKAGVDLLVAPRRHVLDDILLRAALRAGATLWDRTTVRRVLRDASGAVVGVETVDSDGRARQVTADLVVGADGVRSRTAQLVDAPVVQRHAASGACLYAYIGDVPWDGYEFHLADGAFAGVFPTHGRQACVWLIRPRHLSRSLLRAGSRRLDAWRDALTALVPDLGARVSAGSVAGPLRGAVGLPTYVRRAVGAGWALVGDAGYHRDPITGHGITDAFRDAELLADAADLALRAPRAMRTAILEDYQRRRDTALADCLRLTVAISAFPPAATFVELQSELSRALDAEARDLAARPRTAISPLATTPVREPLTA